MIFPTFFCALTCKFSVDFVCGLAKMARRIFLMCTAIQFFDNPDVIEFPENLIRKEKEFSSYKLSIPF